LVGLYSSTEPEVIRAMLKLTIVLNEDYQCREQFAQLSGFFVINYVLVRNVSGAEALVDLLNSEYNEVQLLALEALGACAKNQSNRVIIGVLLLLLLL
jgi:hypothetical protein